MLWDHNSLEGDQMNSVSNLCEECAKSPISVFCVPCCAAFCKPCHKETHNSKVLKGHATVNPSKAIHQAEVTAACEDVLNSHEVFFGEVKYHADHVDIIKSLESALKEQKISISMWDYQVEKIRDKLQSSFGLSVLAMKTHIDKMLNEAVALKIQQLHPLLKSHQNVLEIINMIEKAIKDAESTSSSMKREELLGSLNLVQAATQRAREASKTVVLNIESKLVLENVITPCADIVSSAKSIDPKQVIHVKYITQESFAKAKDAEAKGIPKVAFETMTQAANLNMYEAQLALARYYSTGFGTEKDSSAATYWGTRASYSQKANGELFLFLAREYYNCVKDFKSAQYWALHGAEINDPSCLAFLAMEMDLPDEQRSLWLKKAASAGHVGALLYFAEMFLDMGSIEIAVEYYTKAAENNSIEAQVKLACLLEENLQDFSAAFRWYESAANSGNTVSMFKCGQFYEEGKGVDSDDSVALSWYLKASKDGHAEAQCCAGILLESRDVLEAQKLFKKSAEQGIPLAQYKIAMYYKTRSPADAEKWLALAAAQNHGKACYEYGKIKQEQKQYAEAAVNFGIAAKQDIPEAYFELGMMYSLGQGLAENAARAEECLSKLVELGHPEARSLMKMNSTLSPSSKSNVKKLFAKLVSEMEMKKDSSAILMPESALIAEMFKKSKKGKDTSHKRLFVLHGPFFAYYKDSGDSYATFKMNLRGAKVERQSHKDTKSEFYFQVSKSPDELECFSDKPELVDKWVDAVERAILYYTLVDTKTVFQEIKTKPEDDDLPEENRFNPDHLNSIIKCGWLYKQGGKRKNWNKRWFVLVRDNLFYFKDDHRTSEFPEGGIPLEYCNTIPNANNLMDVSKKHAIAILTLYRNYFLCASSSEEMISWVNAIETASEACTAKTAVNFDELKLKKSSK